MWYAILHDILKCFLVFAWTKQLYRKISSPIEDTIESVGYLYLFKIRPFNSYNHYYYDIPIPTTHSWIVESSRERKTETRICVWYIGNV